MTADISSHLNHIADALDQLAADVLRPEHDIDRLLISLENVGSALAILAAVEELPSEECVFHILHMIIQTVVESRFSPVMSREQLIFLLENNFRVGDIALIFGVSKRTVHRRMSEYGLSVRQTYSDITDEDLQKVITDFIAHCPNSGIRTVTGQLSSQGIRVQQVRVRHNLKAVDPVGNFIRGLQLNIVPRVPYSVPGPLSLWHIDGNHKLIRWRMVIHGGIDGFSRRIMYLQANTNNRASTVLQFFLTAVSQHGLPHRVRSDKGGENIEVARYMLEHPERGPDIGALDADQDLHTLCLHYVFLPRLNWHLQLFVRMWDKHPLATEGNRTPQQLWMAGLLLGQQDNPDQIDDTNWGIDWDGPIAAPDSATVEVPEAPLDLLQRVEGHLRACIDPFQTSEVFGADIYLHAMSEVQAFMAEQT
ncbi:hypothetical protein E1301_Tti019072 [Triplophysa tibetana]|uniref:Integrase catalytic domain-containing protein n=1 Tax=Triplophysa tibetana TaxID=1572043 RepID=A0A5A9NRD9_9TELE|nr:hypothetical protein E1301_Tti019072 [Triplophysa tibetana]